MILLRTHTLIRVWGDFSMLLHQSTAFGFKQITFSFYRDANDHVAMLLIYFRFFFSGNRNNNNKKHVDYRLCINHSKLG